MGNKRKASALQTRSTTTNDLLSKKEEQTSEVLLADQPSSKKWRNWWIRTVTTFMMIGAFFTILASGHLWVILMVMTIQTVVFGEVILIAQGPAKERQMRWYKTISWYGNYPSHDRCTCAQHMLYQWWGANALISYSLADSNLYIFFSISGTFLSPPCIICMVNPSFTTFSKSSLSMPSYCPLQHIIDSSALCFMLLVCYMTWARCMYWYLYRLCFLCGKSAKGSLQASICAIWMDTHGTYSHCGSKSLYCKQHPRGVDLVSYCVYWGVKGRRNNIS